MAGGSGDGAEQWDITSKIAGNLDRHLVFPLLEFLQTRGIYPEEDIMNSKIELLKHTNMVDFAMDIYRQINGTEDVPNEMTERRKVVIGNLRELQATAAPIVDFLLDENKVKDLRNDKAYNIKMLQDQYNIPQDDIEVLFKDFLSTLGSSAVKREPRHEFDTQEEYRFRLGVFNKNVAAIIKQNAFAQAHSTRPDHARFGITTFADWTTEEFETLFDHTIAKGPDMRNTTYLKEVASATTPNNLLSYSCSGTLVIKKPRNQGRCGSCWAFSTSAALRYAYFYKNAGGANECSDKTGGTCRFFNCYASRHATCDRWSGYKCVCPQGTCSTVRV